MHELCIVVRRLCKEGLMSKLTVREQKHINRVLRVIRKAQNNLCELSERAQEGDLFPKTTFRAFVELKDVLHRTEIRVLARDSRAV